MPRDVSYPTAVPMCAGFPQQVLWLGDPVAECAGPSPCSVVGADPCAAGRP